MGNIDYLIRDSNLPFPEYISHAREQIAARRPDLQYANKNHKLVLDSNSPFEYYPDPGQSSLLAGSKKIGILCLHGLLDSPFTWRELAASFKDWGAICKAILLPGHGTQPADLLSVSCEEWIAAMQYGIASLRREVDHILLAGYSTGGALAIWQALQDPQLSGIILLAPALTVKVPPFVLHAFQSVKKYLPFADREWVNKTDELDYAKYTSLPFNAVQQVYALTEKTGNLQKDHALHCPVFLAVTEEDETISTQAALSWFKRVKNKKNQGILYARDRNTYPDKRISIRPACYPQWKIQQLSHVSLPFSPDNPHYGQHGDFPLASRLDHENVVYGACDPISANLLNGLLSRPLTYNPDFDFMRKAIQAFIVAATSSTEERSGHRCR